jgi:hypothetical protein
MSMGAVLRPATLKIENRDFRACCGGEPTERACSNGNGPTYLAWDTGAEELNCM